MKGSYGIKKLYGGAGRGYGGGRRICQFIFLKSRVGWKKRDCFFHLHVIFSCTSMHSEKC